MKCLNCGGMVFEQMPLYDILILATEGSARQLVESHVCMNCGKVELRMPQALIDQRKKEMHKEAERRQAEEMRRQEDSRLLARAEELEKILQDENHTMKEWKEAQRELTEIQDRLHIRSRRVYIEF